MGLIVNYKQSDKTKKILNEEDDLKIWLTHNNLWINHLNNNKYAILSNNDEEHLIRINHYAKVIEFLSNEYYRRIR
jgi:hypothetical protein